MCPIKLKSELCRLEGHVLYSSVFFCNYVMDKTICIDFGTSNSSVWYYRNDRLCQLDFDQGSYLFPSYVMYQQGKPVVGSTAKNCFGNDNSYVIGAVKRLLGLNYDEYLRYQDTHVFGCTVQRGNDAMPYFVVDEKGTLKSPVEVASEIFKAMKEQAMRRMDQKEIYYAFITVPADYDTIRVQAIRQAAEMAGLKVTKFIREPTAAALSWCISHAESAKIGDKFLIYDFGGGTFDVSCIECVGNYQFKVVSTKGLERVGGNTIDSRLIEAVIQHMKDEGIPIINRLKNEKAFLRKIRKLRRQCEEQKQLLISSTEYVQDYNQYIEKNRSKFLSIDFSELIPIGDDDDDDNERDTEFKISLTQFDKIIEDLIKQSIDCVKSLLNELHLKPADIHYVLMVGGSSKIHQTKRRMVELFPHSQFPEVDKESCVANGAAQRMICHYDKNAKVQVKDILQCSYGMRFPSGVVLMVLKGDEIPCESIPLHAVMNGSEEYILTSIYQYDGDADKLRNIHHPLVNVMDSKKIHAVKIRNPNPQYNERKKLEFKLLVHDDGELEMTCLDMNTGRMLESSICDPIMVY